MAAMMPPQLARVIAKCDTGELSTAVGLMELLIATEDADQVSSWLNAEQERSAVAAALACLFYENERGCRRVANMLRADVDRPPQDATVEEGVQFCRSLFDWSVSQSEEASVALYSLGNAEILQAATNEIVRLLESWGLVHPKQDVLDLGCGTGRMEKALAPKLATIVGIDLSPQMVAAACRECSSLANVKLLLSSGLDLAPIQSDAFGLVLSIDSFPYVVQSGWPLVERFFEEVTRVLRPEGQFVVINFSYRGDDCKDRDDAAALASQHGLDLIEAGAKPFRLWNGAVYRFVKTARTND